MKDHNSHYSCTWSPGHDKECHDLMHTRLPLTSNTPRMRRWLFFGDSTMAHLFHRSNLTFELTTSPNASVHGAGAGCFNHCMACYVRKGGRCHLNDVFDLQYPDKWYSLQGTTEEYMFAGPVDFGSTHPHCTDCSGCDTTFLKCDFVPNSTCNEDCVDIHNERKLIYGGYVAMEFALDIEIQTPEFLTTQENLVSYIDRVWNFPEHLREFGKPVCVISAGMHDVKIANVTALDFLRNVKLLLANFIPVCTHIIWLGSTAPSNVPNKRFKKTIPLMKEWDSSVKEMIHIDAEFQESISFIDVYNASLKYGHDGHIHMNNTWYRILGDELITPMMVREGTRESHYHK